MTDNKQRDLSSTQEDDLPIQSVETTGTANPSPLKQSTPWNTIEARVISFVSRKGGVGKTTSAVNLGAALALSGQSVLVVGTDPQCGVSRTLGYGRDELKSGLLEIFTGSHSLTDLAHTTALKNLYFVSPNIWSLDDEEAFLELMDYAVDNFVSQIDRARNLFDTIFIDCPPNLGPATRAALLASDSYLVPIQAEELCRDSLERLLTFIHSFQDEVFAGPHTEFSDGSVPKINLEGMFLTMVNERTRMSRHVIAKVGESYRDHLFTSFIPRTTRLTEMALKGKPVVIYDRKSSGSRAYFNLADEIVERFHKSDGRARTRLSIDAESGGPTIDALTGVTTTKSLQREPNRTTASAPPDQRPASDLQRLLAELGATLPSGGDVPVSSSDSEVPELVSLDEILAEEERAGEDADWDESLWDSEHGPGERPN